MRTKRYVISTALLLLLGSACSQSKDVPKGKLTGEIFVVTNGAQNIRLGLIEVSLLTQMEVTDFLERKKPSAESYRATLQSAYDAAKEDFDSATREAESAKSHYRIVQSQAQDALDRYKSAVNDYGAGKLDYDSTDRFKSETGRLLDQAEEAKKSVDSKLELANAKKAMFDEAEKALILWPTSEFYFQDIPKVPASVMTDADGRFSVEIPTTGRYAIAAHGQRQTVGKTEQYCWMLWISLEGKDSKHIMLSNHNMMESGSTDSVVTVKQKAERAAS